MKKIDKIELNDKANSIRTKLGEDIKSPIDIFNVAGNIDDLTIVLKPLGDNISGVCIKLEKSALIAVNTSYSKGRQNFTLAHELYHYFYTDNNTSTICSSVINEKDSEEIKADIFASYFLLPRLGLNEIIQNNEINLGTILKIENMYGISHKALLTRLAQDDYISDKQYQKYEKNIIRSALMAGYDESLYTRSNSCGTYGYYIKQIFDLYDKEKISEGKKEEFLIDCMRNDLIDLKKSEDYLLD